MRPYPNAAKARSQVNRGDHKQVDRYRAELRYFHVPQRVILGMTNAYEVLDEAFTLTEPQMAILGKVMSDG